MAVLRLPRVRLAVFDPLTSLTSPVDGVTVAKAISLKDKFENLGARYVLYIGTMTMTYA